MLVMQPNDELAISDHFERMLVNHSLATSSLVRRLFHVTVRCLFQLPPGPLQ